ncbi:hypothetical protein CR194_08875 [Salipaludibacillus keqinensis]|uniref:Small peptidoglycan-associated lipoprotein n=1 Tax=Salipaludibacillus keqinensis TaxID=2045207 RepID=A0A323TIC1_9BACI|nr:hypothetical protein [Salipaludibacillus keqinensis]PYZ93297.1 hypothetical protein CR194_08875 [Salipaludibacillus keqinensis]
MSRMLLIIFMSSCFYLTSCGSQAIVSNYPFLDTDGEEDTAVTILFSDDHDYSTENNYYDALIDVQQKHPNKLSNVNIVSQTDTELVQFYEIEQFPTLLLVDDLEVMLRIEGEKDVTSIYSKLDSTVKKQQERSS